MSKNEKPVYELKQVHKQISTPKESLTILQYINLSIYPRETIAIVGASGSGKTTLLHIMGGLDSPSYGKVFFQGEDISLFSWIQKSEIRNKKIGFVFQFHHLLPEFNTQENVAMPMIIAGGKKQYFLSKAQEVLEMVGLKGQEKQPVSTLSGGERQLAAIARAILQNPEVILADEPTGNLDANNGEKIGNLLVRLNQELGTTLMVVTHNEELANKMKRRLRLHAGELYNEQ